MTASTPPERLQVFFDASITLLCTADASTNTFVDLNPAWTHILGWELDELRSRPFIEFIHPDDLQPTFDVITDMTKRGLDTVNFENRYRHKDGRWVWLSWHAHFQGTTFYASARDIGPYREALEAVERANDELRQFAYAASHDLQEPLRSIVGHLHQIDASTLSEEGRRSIEHVTAGAARMRALLDALLRLSRVDAGSSKLSPVAMNRPLNDAMDVLSQAISESDARIVQDGSWPTLRVDRAQISEVFQNLIANSIKYRTPGSAPQIQVKAHAEGKGWRFEVTDDGIGFPADRANRAFQIFQRLHRRSKYPGMGVGLALVQRIVHRHHGRVGIRSERGQGTTAWFWLPEGEQSA